MRIIKRARLVEFWTKRRNSETALKRWFELTSVANWRSFIEVKATFPAADLVTTQSGRTCIIFDIGGNNYRMITAIHFNTQIVYILRILTHTEYDAEKWKKEL